MLHSYDIFEVLPNGDLIWKDVVEGRMNAIVGLQAMALGKRNEYRLMDLDTVSVIATTHKAIAHLFLPLHSC
jgi:hypothetical protein